ncbi:MAG: hypothetical protein IJ357_07400, partial [Oscillospiraceae bacterium]|nr:hypothetical protein [Oscillospiraceae bacterium]
MKKEEKLYDAITEIDDELVEEAQQRRQRPSRRKLWYGLTAACLALALCVGAVALWWPEAEPADGGSMYNSYSAETTLP